MQLMKLQYIRISLISLNIMILFPKRGGKYYAFLGLHFFIAFFITTSSLRSQTYNNLWIPDTLSGKSFDLNIRDTFTQLRPGNQTITAGINHNIWGPTLFFNQGDTVHMTVRNNLNDSTTIHWHGMHLPAIMDGGPHQIIPPGTIWQPYWKVTNNASTYWYHPHLHQMTQEHLTKGIGGFIIVRDPVEAALKLPRTYGIDDIPIVLTSRRYDASNAFVYTNIAYGDYMLTNGTPNAQVNLPKQFVRLRILNAEIERGYMLGFSDNRTFYVIGNDGGLLDAPVPETRVKVLIGERIEILVDLSNDAVGSSLDLKAYNSGQPFGFPGGEPGTSGPLGSLLNNIDFSVLHINVVAATSNPITSLPATLVKNTYWTASDATVNKTVNVTDGTPGPGGKPFSLDGQPFNLVTINKTVNLNAIEKWTITNNNVFSHAFHIHDIEFKIISRSSGAVGNYELGWKDVVALPKGESVTFVAKFDDYADSIHPYMYHCHFSNHEDGGMMGQFVVYGPNNSSVQQDGSTNSDYSIFPNPANNRLYVSYSDPNNSAYYARITNATGRTLFMLPRPQTQNGIDISNLIPGTYFLQLTDELGKKTLTKKFIKE